MEKEGLEGKVDQGEEGLELCDVHYKVALFLNLIVLTRIERDADAWKFLLRFAVRRYTRSPVICR
jgi:hypothetical protein